MSRQDQMRDVSNQVADHKQQIRAAVDTWLAARRRAAALRIEADAAEAEADATFNRLVAHGTAAADALDAARAEWARQRRRPYG